MLKYLFIIIYLICFLTINSYCNDTLVYYSELEFNSEYEEKIFGEYFKNSKKDYLALFLAIDSLNNENTVKEIRKGYQNQLNEYHNNKFNKYSPKKKIKTIYKTVHNQFFDKYELETLFNDIFQDGVFNCLTGSALYAIFLEDLNIPFVLKENPLHVYLVAFPKTHNLKIESTDPIAGFYNYDYRVKNNFVEHLRRNKLISLQEYESSTVNELFDRYYFTEKDISIDELIGLHYLNHAAYLMDDKKMREAYKQLEKAYMFYNSEKTIFMLFVSLTGIVSSSEYDDYQDWKYLAKLARYKDVFEISNDQIIGEFERLTKQILINNSQMGLYIKTYNNLKTNIKDTLLRKEIIFVYNFEIGRYLYSKGDVEEGFEHFELAYQLKPNNSDIQTLFIHSLSSILTNRNSKEKLKQIENYAENYTGLNRNGLFKSLLLEAYLGYFGFCYETRNFKEGEKYKSKFENIYNQNSELPVSSRLIEKAYSEAAVYYFRKSNYNKSKVILKKGLEFVPGSFELRLRLSSF